MTSRIPPAYRPVLDLLAACPRSVADAARWSGLDRRRAWAAVRWLERNGLAERQRGGHRLWRAKGHG